MLGNEGYDFGFKQGKNAGWKMAVELIHEQLAAIVHECPNDQDLGRSIRKLVIDLKSKEENVPG